MLRNGTHLSKLKYMNGADPGNKSVEIFDLDCCLGAQYRSKLTAWVGSCFAKIRLGIWATLKRTVDCPVHDLESARGYNAIMTNLQDIL
jgi:hypothetical protein